MISIERKPAITIIQPARKDDPTQTRHVLSKAVIRASDRLGLTSVELAKVLGLSTASVSRLRAGTYALDPSTKSWELGMLFVRLFRGLDAITGGDDESARAWLRNPNIHLRDVPAERIQSVQGLVETVSYVDAYRAIA